MPNTYESTITLPADPEPEYVETGGSVEIVVIAGLLASFGCISLGLALNSLADKVKKIITNKLKSN